MNYTEIKKFLIFIKNIGFLKQTKGEILYKFDEWYLEYDHYDITFKYHNKNLNKEISSYNISKDLFNQLKYDKKSNIVNTKDNNMISIDFILDCWEIICRCKSTELYLLKQKIKKELKHIIRKQKIEKLK